MPKEYIERKALLDKSYVITKSTVDNPYGGKSVVDVEDIEDVPAADVVEVIHSKWEISSDGYYPFCEHCNHEPKNGVMSKFCPECGAKMDNHPRSKKFTNET